MPATEPIASQGVLVARAGQSSLPHSGRTARNKRPMGLDPGAFDRGRRGIRAAILAVASCIVGSHRLAAVPAEPPPRVAALSPEVWRAERRIVDLHTHVEALPERLERAIGILDRAGIGQIGRAHV